MVRRKNTSIEEVSPELVEETMAVEASPLKEEVTVKYRLGTRTYTKAVHGDNFYELAKSFADKQGGILI